MPNRAPMHRPHGWQPPEITRKQQRQQRDSRKGSSTQRGYGADWRRLRKAFLTANPLCVMCAEEGRVTAASVVDHIEGINEAPERRLDPDNLRALCKPHHDARTAKDQAFGRGYATMPAWLKPSAIPLTIICGPPGSGKTTCARDRADRTDTVIDLDQIMAEMSGLPWYEADDGWIGPAMRKRNEMLGNLSRQRKGRAWFIVSAPTADERGQWRDLLQPDEVVVMETSAGMCEARIAKDERRGHLSRLYGEIASKWWSRYTKDDRDTVL